MAEAPTMPSPVQRGAGKRNRNDERFRAQFRKTGLCAFFARGWCSKGMTCNFAHGRAELQPMPDLTKTSVCQKWLQFGCPNSAADCPFAHGSQELRTTEAYADRSSGGGARGSRRAGGGHAESADWCSLTAEVGHTGAEVPCTPETSSGFSSEDSTADMTFLQPTMADMALPMTYIDMKPPGSTPVQEAHVAGAPHMAAIGGGMDGNNETPKGGNSNGSFSRRGRRPPAPIDIPGPVLEQQPSPPGLVGSPQEQHLGAAAAAAAPAYHLVASPMPSPSCAQFVPVSPLGASQAHIGATAAATTPTYLVASPMPSPSCASFVPVPPMGTSQVGNFVRFVPMMLVPGMPPQVMSPQGTVTAQSPEHMAAALMEAMPDHYED